MRKHILAAGIAAAALFPSMAFAQSSCEQQQSNRVVGTVAGGAIGAVAGGAIAGHDHRTAGAIVGAVGGAIVGNQLTRPNADCAHAYGYYDNAGSWHANSVNRSAATGYYDRDGKWMDGTPNGYYDSNGRWTNADSRADQSGYYDRNGRWVPASSNGYYDSDGRWVAGAASGYYENGRWVSGPATGRYDANGRWMPGAANGHRNADGVWIADAQPGYYDSNGRWHAGEANGYYDGGGRWVATSGYSNSNNHSTNDNGRWGDAPANARERVSWLRQRISDGQRDGTLNRVEARRSSHTLSMISQRESRMRHYRNGQLSQRDNASIQAQLDNLSSSIRMQIRQG